MCNGSGAAGTGNSGVAAADALRSYTQERAAGQQRQAALLSERGRSQSARDEAAIKVRLNVNKTTAARHSGEKLPASHAAERYHQIGIVNREKSRIEGIDRKLNEERRQSAKESQNYQRTVRNL